MTFVFEFSELTAQKFDALVDDLLHPYYADAVVEWRSQYRKQLSEQERKRRMAQLPQWKEECPQ